MQEKVAKPPRMVRKQILITPEQNRRLKDYSSRTTVAESDLVRAGIDMKLAQLDSAGDQEWKQRLLATAGVWKDRPDIVQRIEENKIHQRKAWRKRIARTRKLLAGI